jgi:hypothetical protein
MDEIIFSDFGVEILKRREKLFVRYDGGELVVKLVEHEVSEAESAQIQTSEEDAYKVIVRLQSSEK